MFRKGTKNQDDKADPVSQLLDKLHKGLRPRIRYDNKKRVLQKIQDRVDTPERDYRETYTPDHSNRFRTGFSYRIAGIAASIVLIALAVFYVVRDGNEQVRDEPLSHGITKENAAGQKSLVHLPDGTRVWLNSDSRLHFPSIFEGSRRVVSLEGEAFFEVAKNPNCPFIVYSGAVRVRAIGTAFNIMAFEEKQDIIVSLLEGKIAVSSGLAEERTRIIEPGWAVSVGKGDNIIRAYECNVDDKAAWKDGLLIFDNEPFEAVVFKLERWYGVRIHVSGTPDRTYGYKGRFKNEYLANILESMQYGKAFDYEIDGTEVYIDLN